MIWPSFCGPSRATEAQRAEAFIENAESTDDAKVDLGNMSCHPRHPAQAPGATARTNDPSQDGRGHERAADGAHVF